jgi:hypothetical protein
MSDKNGVQVPERVFFYGEVYECDNFIFGYLNVK